MREILLKPQLHKFHTFEEFHKEFQIGKRDLLLTNKFIYDANMAELGIECQCIFQEQYGAGEPSEEMLEAIFADADPSAYDRVIAVGGGAIMDICKVLSVKRTGSIHDLFFKKCEVIHEKEVIAIPTTCGTGSEVTNISVAIVKDENGKTTKLGLVSDLIIPNTVCLMPFLRTPSTRAPTTAPQTVPIPPDWLVPPIVVAAIAVSS